MVKFQLFKFNILNFTHSFYGMSFLVYKKPGLTPGRGQNIATCDYDKPPGRGKVCDVDVKAFDECTEEHRFNFDRQGPCIFLKLNKVSNIKNKHCKKKLEKYYLRWF